MKNYALLAALCAALIGISQQTASAQDALAEPAVMAPVDSLTTEVLAGDMRPGGSNGFRTAATFNGPEAIAADSKGNVFVADGHSVRKISADGRVSAFAGSTDGYADGPGVTARFGKILGLAIDADDNLYVADAYTRRIRKITPDAYVSTLAGSTTGHRDGIGADAQFTLPRSIAVDAAGNVYVGDDKINKIRKITPDGAVTTIAGNAAIQFSQPRGIAVDAAGFVYVLDGITIKRIAHDDSVLMMAADMTFNVAANEDNRAKFGGRGGIAVDAAGNLYVTSTNDKTLVKITPEGVRSTIASNDDSHWIGQPNDVAVGASGNFYLADNHNHVVHQLTAAGNVGPLPGIQTPEAPAPQPAPAKETVSEEELVALFKSTKKLAKNDVDALFRLGNMHEEGRGTRKNWIKASRTYKKAAKKGHAAAQFEHGLDHLNGTISYGLSITNGDVAAAEARQLAKRRATAAGWYAKSADQGYAPAQHALAWLYFNGHGVEKNGERAIELLTVSAEQGFFDAQFELAEFYRKGEGVEVDLAQAIDWYGRASDQGDFYSTVMMNALIEATAPADAVPPAYAEAHAQTELALQLHEGVEIERDLARAAKLFEQPAVLGDTTAQRMLGLMYLNGEGVAQDSGEAASWLNLATQLGDADAQFWSGYLYERGMGVPQALDRATYWYARAAEQGNVLAQTSLGYLYYADKNVGIDHAASRDWYSKAAGQGDAQAQYAAGWLHLSNRDDAQSATNALALFNDAAAQGHLEASRMVPVTTRAVDGDAIAQYELGRRYEEGREVPKSPQNAMAWYAKSAEQGYVEGQFRLGMMTRYRTGEIPQDIVASSAWLQTAADAGHVEAGAELANLMAEIQRKEDRETDAFISAIEEMVRTIKNRDK